MFKATQPTWLISSPAASNREVAGIRIRYGMTKLSAVGDQMPIHQPHAPFELSPLERSRSVDIDQNFRELQKILPSHHLGCKAQGLSESSSVRSQAFPRGNEGLSGAISSGRQSDWAITHAAFATDTAFLRQNIGVAGLAFPSPQFVRSCKQ